MGDRGGSENGLGESGVIGRGCEGAGGFLFFARISSCSASGPLLSIDSCTAENCG